ncbi:hypothetical protein [Paenibacillus donghaensis]|nr:hypothetical protein [Paenibacillus donghaensis]
MNLVGHNMALVEELKIYMIKKLNEYNSGGFIVEGRFDELLRLKVMSEWL